MEGGTNKVGVGLAASRSSINTKNHKKNDHCCGEFFLFFYVARNILYIHGMYNIPRCNTLWLSAKWGRGGLFLIYCSPSSVAFWWQITNYCQKEQAARFEPMVLFIWLVIFVYCSMQPCSTTLNYTYLNPHCKTQTEPKLVQHESETSWRVLNKGLYHIQKIKTQWSKLSVLDFDEISKLYYIIIPNWNVNRRKL